MTGAYFAYLFSVLPSPAVPFFYLHCQTFFSLFLFSPLLLRLPASPSLIPPAELDIFVPLLTPTLPILYFTFSPSP